MTYKIIFNSFLLILLFIGVIALGIWMKYLSPISTPKPISEIQQIRKSVVVKTAWQPFPAPGICFEFRGVEIKANDKLNKKECK